MANGFGHQGHAPSAGQGCVHENGFSADSERLLVPVGAGNDSSSSKLASNCKEHPIGRGAFGDVWSAVDPRSGRRVALKRLANIFASSHSAIRALREITCLTALRHDNILSAVDILQLPCKDECQDLYVLTEPMDSDLFKILVSNQPLTITHVKVFVYQILRGLKYLHSGKIIHRDIKPANILVNANCSIKICDFGLIRDGDTTQAMTQDVSTQFYRAPEMLMGAKHYTTSVDIWATGCVLAELLNRRILFAASSPIQQLDLIMEVVGTPQMDDMKFACDAAKGYVLRKTPRRSEVTAQILECHSAPDYCAQEAVQLLRLLLVFNPEKRATASKALQSNYVKYGRNCYHSTICSCHPSRSKHFKVNDEVPFSADSDDTEPPMLSPSPLQLEDKMEENPPSIDTIRNELYRTCLKLQEDNSQNVCINTRSPICQQLTDNGSLPKQS